MAEKNLFNPFPGLRPFGAEEDYLFFGREEQTNELLQLLRTHRFLAVVGTSGSGKSSLVRAGLLPALYGGTMVGAGSDWETVVFRPGGDPLLNLSQAMIDADLYDSEDEEAPLRIRATLSRSRLGLVQAIEQSELPENTNLLIVVDQFEELFRFRDTSSEHQERATAFVKVLLNAASAQDMPIYVAITMRSDYLGDCAQLPGLAEAVNDGEYLIPKLTRDQRRDAIEKPVAVGGGQISPALLQQLLNDVGDDADQLPILQHALMRIWNKWEQDHQDEEPVDLRHYDSVGGMQSALSIHADEVYEGLPDDSSRTLAERVFRAITERGEDDRGIRRPTRLDHLCAIVDGKLEDVKVILDAYRQTGRTFVMPLQDVALTEETVIDISHESLMRVWQRLRGWVDQESQSSRIYRRLADTAALHEEGQAGVYRDPDLQIASTWRDTSNPTAAWADRYHDGFALAMVFLNKSWEVAHAEEEERERARQRELEQAKQLALAQQQAKRRSYMIAAALAVGFLVALYLMSVANEQRNLARENEAEAIRQEEIAKENENEAKRQEGIAKENEAEAVRQEGIARKNEAEANTQAELARLAREEARKGLYFSDMSQVIRESESTRGANYKIAAVKEWLPTPSETDFRNWEWYLAASPSVGVEREYNTVSWGWGGIGTAYHSPLMVIARSSNQLEIINYETNSPVVVHDQDFATAVVRYSIDDKRLLCGGVDGVIRVVEPKSGVVILRYSALSERIQEIDISSDGQTIFVKGQTSASIVDIKSHTIQPIPITDAAQNLFLAISPDGKFVSYTATDGRIRITHAADTTQTRDIQTTTEELQAISWAPSGTEILFIDSSGVIHFLNATDGSELRTVRPGRSSSLSRIEWSRDGNLLAVGGNGGVVYCLDKRNNYQAVKMPQLEGNVWQISWGHTVDSLLLHHGQSRASVIKNPLNYSLSRNLGLPSGLNNWLIPVDISRDGKLIAYSNNQGVYVVNSENGNNWKQIYSDEKAMFTVSFSSDGKYLAGIGGNAGLRIWETDSWELIGETTDIRPSVRVAWSPNNKMLACGGWTFSSPEAQNYIELIDITNPSDPVKHGRLEVVGHNFTISWDNTGKYLASAGFSGRVADDRVFIFNTETMQRIATATGALIFVHALNFVPGEQTLLAGGHSFTGEGFIDAIDFSQPTVNVISKSAHFRRVVDIDCSPDGTRIVSSSLDQTAKLWDRESLSEIAVLTEANDPMWKARWNTQGTAISALSLTGDLFKWDAAIGMRTFGATRTTTDLSDDQLAQMTPTEISQLIDTYVRSDDWTEATSLSARYSNTKDSEPVHSRWWISSPVKVDLDETSDWERDKVVFNSHFDQQLFSKSWRPVIAERNGILNLASFSNSAEFSSIYALRRIYVSRAGTYGVFLSSDDFHRLWVNGKAVHENRRVRQATPDSDFVRTELLEGWNTFLLKTYNENGAFGAYLRVTSNSVDLAKGLIKNGNFTEAVSILDQAVLNDPQSQRLQLERLKAAVQADNHQLVLEDSEDILKQIPGSADLLFKRARALKTLGKTDESILAFQKCIEVNPSDSQAWIELARAYRSAGNTRSEQHAFTQAIVTSNANQSVLERVALESEHRILVGNSRSGGAKWRFTLNEPSDDSWQSYGFDDQHWLPVSFPSTQGNRALRTFWNESWLRTEFNMEDIPEGTFAFHIGNGSPLVDAYINGIRILDFKGKPFHDGDLLSSPTARAALQEGRNTLAIRANSSWGSNLDPALTIQDKKGYFSAIAQRAMDQIADPTELHRFLAKYYATRLNNADAAFHHSRLLNNRTDVSEFDPSMIALHSINGHSELAQNYISPFLAQLDAADTPQKESILLAALSFKGTDSFNTAVLATIGTLTKNIQLSDHLIALAAYRSGNYKAASDTLMPEQLQWNNQNSDHRQMLFALTESHLGNFQSAVEPLREAYRRTRARLCQSRNLGRNLRIITRNNNGNNPIYITSFNAVNIFAKELIQITDDNWKSMDQDGIVARTYALLSYALLNDHFSRQDVARDLFQLIMDQYLLKRESFSQTSELRRLDAAILWALATAQENARPGLHKINDFAMSLRPFFDTSGNRWTVLKPVNMESVSGTTLESDQTGAVLATGANPASETYKITLESSLNRITAFRMDVLPDDSMFFGGPGRHAGGNFHVHLVQYFEDDSESPLTMIDTSVDYDQFGTGRQGHSTPGVKRLWAVWGRLDEDHQTVMDLDKPLAEVKGRRFRVEVTSDDPTFPQVSVGKMRFYANDSDGPITVNKYGFYDAASHTSAYSLAALISYQAENFKNAESLARQSVSMSDGGNIYDWMILANQHKARGEEQEASNWNAKAEKWSQDNASGEPLLNSLFKQYTNRFTLTADGSE